MADGGTGQVIVVGVDGSEDSKEALRWAADQAKLTGAQVRATLAWEAPVSMFFVPSYTEDDHRHDAEQTLEKTVTEALGDEPGVPVASVTVENRPAVALVEESADAELLVLGAHGCGDFPRTHLGSVASYCIRHAVCPVEIVCRNRR